MQNSFKWHAWGFPDSACEVVHLYDVYNHLQQNWHLQRKNCRQMKVPCFVNKVAGDSLHLHQNLILDIIGGPLTYKRNLGSPSIPTKISPKYVDWQARKALSMGWVPCQGDITGKALCVDENKDIFPATLTLWLWRSVGGGLSES